MASASATSSLVTLIDALVSAPKELAGDLQPGRNNRDEQLRFEWSVLVNGEGLNCYLAFTQYLNDVPPRFTIVLVYREISVWRLDFEPNQRVELNPPLLGHRYSEALIRGAHWHRWTENRHFVQGSASSIKLPFRVPYEGPMDGPNVWENAFREFLDAVAIAQIENRRMPQWPTRSRLV